MKIDNVFKMICYCYNECLKEKGITEVEFSECTVDGGKYFGLFEKLKEGRTRRKRLDYCIDMDSLSYRVCEKYNISYRKMKERAQEIWDRECKDRG